MALRADHEPDWSQAKCQGLDPGMFVITQPGRPAAPAKKVCATCPIREQCGTWAKAMGMQGIWGGEVLAPPRSEIQDAQPHAV